MLSKLFKPKWQHKDPAVRLKALKSLDGSSPELILIATSDNSPEVRLHTVQYLLHIPTLKKLADEPGENFSAAVTKRVTDLVLEQPDIADLDKVYGLIDDLEIHQQVATDDSYIAAIRSQAITQIDDQEVLFSIANTDASKPIQYLAASQLTDYSQLKKLRKFSKTNKKLRNLLKEKGAEFQKQHRLVDQLNGYCDEIEALANEGKDHKRFSEIQQQWQKISSSTIPSSIPSVIPSVIPLKEQERFNATSSAFESAHETYQKEQKKLQPLRDKAHGVLRDEDDLLHALTHSTVDFTEQDFAKGLQSIKTNWAALDSDLPMSDLPISGLLIEEKKQLSLKYGEKLSSIEASLAALKGDFRSVDQMKKVCKKAERALSGKQAIHNKTIVGLEKQWQQIKVPASIDFGKTKTAFTEAMNQLRVKQKAQASQLKDNVKEMDTLLNTMEQSINDKQFNNAIPAYHNAYKLLDNMQGVDKKNRSSIRRRLKAATPEIRHAKSWLHWGSDNARGQLLERAQALIADTKIQPLERAKQVQVLRNEWKKLGKMDPGKHQQLWVAFDAACSKAYEPCQTFYKQASAQRGDNLDTRLTICKQLEALEKQTDWKTVDWKAISKTINQLRGQWRHAGNVNRSSWIKANKRFNDVVDALEVHLGKERRHNLLQRQHLITQAQALVETLDNTDDIEVALEQATQSAKSLQSKWKTTVTGKRGDEQKLWDAFRQAIDAVFDRQRQVRSATQDVLMVNLKKKQDLCSSIHALAKLEGDELLASQHKLTDLEDAFNEISDLPRNSQKSIEQKFAQSRKAAHEKIEQEMEARKISQLLLLGEKYRLCSRKQPDGKGHEKCDEIKKSWDALATLQDEKLEKHIQQRFSSTSLSDEERQENTNQSQHLLLEIEILLDLDTPEDYRQERMKFQVERLSEQMATVSDMHQSNEEQALQKIQDWYLVGAVMGDQLNTINTRFEKVEDWLNLKNSVETTANVYSTESKGFYGKL